MTIYMCIATISYFFMILGLFFRRNRRFHIPLMHLTVVMDLTLVLMIEFQRSAIQTVLEFSLNSLQLAHVLTSTLTVLVYFPLLWLGWRMVLGKAVQPQSRILHKKIGWTAFVLRTLGFVLMFSMLERVK